MKSWRFAILFVLLVAGGLALFFALALASGAVAPAELKRMLRRA